ncbi:MAG: UTP--glucose-1-phosphate uridylyltransferase, partial [Bacilli bacterium]|nr:UTP--glucose-1-phosphate uridylyltransferase [Bacilli bacterium]
FFTKQNFFKYPNAKITDFSQKSLPILDIHCNILLKNKKEILKVSNGNGEVFKALKYHNILTKMKNQNIKYIQICNIDNILCKAFDPIFVGLMKQNNFQIGSKTFIKDNDNEKEYVFCKYQNKPILLPYKIVYEKIKQNTEMSLSILDTFSGISIFTIEALEKLQNMKLPYHRAYKAYNYIDINGSQIDSKEKNAFKFEKYIFDAFFEFEDMLLYRVDKQTEFAPIKNKTGENSPETAIKQFEQLTKKDSY